MSTTAIVIIVFALLLAPSRYFRYGQQRWLENRLGDKKRARNALIIMRAAGLGLALFALYLLKTAEL